MICEVIDWLHDDDDDYGDDDDDDDYDDYEWRLLRQKLSAASSLRCATL